jgi:hypothetical protein
MSWSSIQTAIVSSFIFDMTSFLGILHVPDFAPDLDDLGQYSG